MGERPRTGVHPSDWLGDMDEDADGLFDIKEDTVTPPGNTVAVQENHSTTAQNGEYKVEPADRAGTLLWQCNPVEPWSFGPPPEPERQVPISAPEQQMPTSLLVQQQDSVRAAGSPKKRAKPVSLRTISKLKQSQTASSASYMTSSTPFVGSHAELAAVSHRQYLDRWSMTQSDDFGWASSTRQGHGLVSMDFLSPASPLETSSAPNGSAERDTSARDSVQTDPVRRAAATEGDATTPPNALQEVFAQAQVGMLYA